MFAVVALLVAVGLVWAGPAWAYIDPGTGGYVYSMVAPLLAMAGAALAFVFRPVRHFFGSFFRLFKPRRAKDNHPLDEEERN